MEMLLKQNDNGFAMKYILSEDVQAGDLRADLLQNAYTERPETKRKESLSGKELLAERAWERFVARQTARTQSGKLKAALAARIA